MIIPAKNLRVANTRDEVIEMFCDSLMENIQNAVEKGLNKICFDATIWYNETTGEIALHPKKEWQRDEYTAYKYRFDDYEDEICQKFVANGYKVQPTGYIGGVWQRTKDILW